jgi:hypothetical protein
MESHTITDRRLLFGYRQASEFTGFPYWRLLRLVKARKVRALKPSRTTIVFYADELAEDIEGLRIG